ncbi:MAG: hypothetical protein ACTSQE_15745 [Candidatus Heimdallarchaeaceae archaeon]
MTGRRIAVPFRERDIRWNINVDFLPPLSIQAELDAKQEIYQLSAHISELTGRRVDTGVFSDLKFEIKTMPSTFNFFEINWGSEDPEDYTRTTQEELWNEVISQVEIPDAIIKRRGVIHQVPDCLDHISPLQDADYLYDFQKGYGNRARALRDRLRVRVANPYNIIKADLLQHGIVHTGSDPLLKRIRSLLGTEYLLPSNNKGYDVLFPHQLEILRTLRGTKFWQDTAIPGRVVGDIDSSRMEAVLYKLDSRPGIIGL